MGKRIRNDAIHTIVVLRVPTAGAEARLRQAIDLIMRAAARTGMPTDGTATHNAGPVRDGAG